MYTFSPAIWRSTKKPGPIRYLQIYQCQVHTLNPLVKGLMLHDARNLHAARRSDGLGEPGMAADTGLSFQPPGKGHPVLAASPASRAFNLLYRHCSSTIRRLAIDLVYL